MEELTVIQFPSARNPVLAYVNSLRSESSRITMMGCVKTLTTLQSKPFGQWRFEDTSMLFAALSYKYQSPSTLNKHLACARGILKACRDLDLMDDRTFQACIRPLKTVKGSRLQAGRIVEEGEIRDMVDACNVDTPIGARDAAMLYVLRSGLRRDEVCDLMFEDVDADMCLHVIGKGDKERLVPLPMGAANVLGRWMMFRGQWIGPLFCEVNRKYPGERLAVIPGQHRLSGEAIRLRLIEVRKEAGVKRCTPHDFRRTVASELLDKTDPKTAQDLLGHDNIRTTMRYDRRGDERLKEAMKLIRMDPKGEPTK